MCEISANTVTKNVIKPTCNNLTFTRINHALIKVKCDSNTIFLLYDDLMKLNFYFYHYINIVLADSPESTRKKKSTELTWLFDFITINKLDTRQLTKQNIFDLILYFGKETDRRGSLNKLTALNCLYTYRSFFAAENLNQGLLDEYSIPAIRHFIADSYLKGDIKQGQAAGEYMNRDDFSRLFQLLYEEAATQIALTAELMYNYGLTANEIKKLTSDWLYEEDERKFLVIETDRILISDLCYKRLKAFFEQYSSIEWKTQYNKMLREYFAKIGLETQALYYQNLTSMFHRSFIYNAVFDNGQSITPDKLAKITRIKNKSYLKSYIKNAREMKKNGATDI